MLASCVFLYKLCDSFRSSFFHSTAFKPFTFHYYFPPFISTIQCIPIITVLGIVRTIYIPSILTMSIYKICCFFSFSRYDKMENSTNKLNEMCCILLTRMFSQAFGMRMTIVKILYIDRGRKVMATNRRQKESKTFQQFFLASF